MKNKNQLGRRSFFRLAAIGGLGSTLISPLLNQKSFAQEKKDDDKPATNIADALRYERTPWSMPGKYPGKVVQVNHTNCITDNEPLEEAAYQMVAKGMLALTGASSLAEAWLQFVQPTERIGLKVNPVAGKQLTTSHAVTKSVIKQLVEAGIPQEQLVIWDRRLMDLNDTGFTAENYPGIRIRGTEQMDSEGGFYGKDGILYGEKMIDKDWYYWADCEEDYDAYTLPYMVNKGKESYFTKICTQELDKIINIPILKNAGTSVTLCMKNLAYGAITNTARLHKKLWSDTSAQVCAFPPLRDKVVLNIVDGIRGCYDGGPGANPQFFHDFKMILVGSDPVAVDRIGYETVIKKRIAEGVQEEEVPRGRKFMEMAQELNLGVADREKISLLTVDLT